MIPYPDPYQCTYQQRRLGTLGIEWRPSSVKFAVGPTYSTNAGDYQMPPILDLDRWVEPLPEFLDAIDWEPPEYEVQSDDNDSEYNVTDENSSEAEHESLIGCSSGEPECTTSDSGDKHKDGVRRSKRKNHKSEVQFMTSSGRRVKRRDLDERDGTTLSKTHKKRKSRHRGFGSRKKSSKSKAMRPQRRSARNALNLFSKITAGSSDEEDVELISSSSEGESDSQDSSTQSIESESSMQHSGVKPESVKCAFKDECEVVEKPSQPAELQESPVNRRRLVLKLPCRDSKTIISENTKSECHEQEAKADFLSKATSDEANLKENHFGAIELADSSGDAVDMERGSAEKQEPHNLSTGHNGRTMRWGEYKARSSKRLKLGDTCITDTWHPPRDQPDDHNIDHIETNGHMRLEDEDGSGALEGLNATNTGEQSWPDVNQRDQVVDHIKCNGRITETANRDKVCRDSQISEVRGKNEPPNGYNKVFDIKNTSYNASHNQEPEKNTLKFRIKSNGLTRENTSSSSKLKSVAVENCRSSKHDLMPYSFHATKRNSLPTTPEEDDGTSGQSLDHSDWNEDGSGSLDTWADTDHSKKPHLGSHTKMFSAVYKRSKSSRGRKFSDKDVCVEGSTSNFDNQSDALVDVARRTRSMGKNEIDDSPFISNSGRKGRHSSSKQSRNGGDLTMNGQEDFLFDEWRPTLRAVGLRSARNRRENYSSDLRPLGYKKYQQPGRKLSWLMLTEHEESYRYIPQLGDEVLYLRQGHEEYTRSCHRSYEAGPLKIKGIKAVEVCKVQSLDYSTLPGSGESCCKLILEFIDPSSAGFGKTFRLTLPELVTYPDFLVERTRYDASIERNWTHRDRCQVWWRNEDGTSGSWWEGRILEVKPKSAEFPESPWERYIIRYKSDPSGKHTHSPWELHDEKTIWQHPHIHEDTRDDLLTCIANLEKASTKKDKYGIEKLNQVAYKSDFLNRFPVPLSLDVIKSRLENNYYRTLEAVRHDALVMVSNTESYFGKNIEMTTKMRRLKEWVEETFSSL